MAGEQRVLELRAGRCPRSRAPRGRAARRPGSGRWRCAAAPPSPGPRPTPTRGAGRRWRARGARLVDVMRANLSPGPRHRRRDRPPGGGRPRQRPVPSAAPWSSTGTWRAARRRRRPAPHLARGRLRRRRLGGRRRCPGHWRSTPAFADTDGPLLYRRSFDAIGPGRGPPRLADLRRPLLPRRRVARRRLPRRHRGLLRSRTPSRSPTRSRARGEHHLAVEVTCTPPDRPHRQAQPHRRLPALGLPRPRLEPRRHLAAGPRRPRPGPVRIARLRALCREATAERAVLVLRATLDSDAARTVCRAQHARRRSTTSPTSRWPPGANDVEWTVTVDRPALWWPRALGDADAPRRPRAASCSPPTRAAAPPTSATLRTGLRQVRLRSWIASVNGERLFLKGVEPRPDPHGARRGHARASSPRDVALAMRRRPRPAAGPRPHHPARAVRRGRRGRACCSGRTSRCSGATPAASASRPCARPRAAVDLLGHHPSIAIWCGHNEPMAIDNDPAMWGDPKAARAGWPCKAAAAQELPTWNKTVLDRSVKPGAREGRRHPAGHRPLRRAPPPAAARRHRQPPLLRLVPRRRARPPRLPRAPCPGWPASSPSSAPRPCPTDADVLRARALARPRLGAPRPHATRCRRPCSTGTCRPADHATFDEWRAATQALPGRGRAPARRDAAPPQVPADRRLRPVLLRRRPPGGHVVGARPRPRARSSASTRCAPPAGPVIVVADRLPAAVAPGAGARPRRPRRQRPARRRSTTPRSPPRCTWPGGEPRLALAAATSPPTAASASARVQIVVPDARRRRSCSTLALPARRRATVDNRYEADDQRADRRRPRIPPARGREDVGSVRADPSTLVEADRAMATTMDRPATAPVHPHAAPAGRRGRSRSTGRRSARSG